MKPLFFFSILIFLFTAGCSTVMQKTGEFVDGSVFAEKKAAAYRTGGKKQRREEMPGIGSGTGILVEQVRRKNGEEFIALGFEALPTLRLLGSSPDAEGNFSLDSLELFCPNLSGWNEFSREISGTGVFYVGPDGKTAVLRLNGEAETLDITSGRIRRKSARITGDQAVTLLRNRQERVSVLAEWMHEAGGGPNGPNQGGFANQEEFEEYWEPILFPEVVKAEKRPPEWTGERAGPRVWGGDVRWNTAYTDAIFPEELRPVRNSGTLLRDWEEAAAWVFLQYEWDRIITSLEQKIELTRIK
jgi:hypothetical protein